ncbi:hypothetical protein [Wolbachia endosymbiont of Tetranychus urticae]|uniref:hypothetical protein n=1 Tax=Wolbachia endosymbiont of Tetranychus urticae TaxID=169184 RepID=UPI00397DAD57
MKKKSSTDKKQSYDLSTLKSRLKSRVDYAYQQGSTLYKGWALYKKRQYLVSYLFGYLGEDILDIVVPTKGQPKTINYELISDVILYCQYMSSCTERHNYIKRLVNNLVIYIAGNKFKTRELVYALEDEVILILVDLINTNRGIFNDARLIEDIQKFSVEKKEFSKFKSCL